MLVAMRLVRWWRCDRRRLCPFGQTAPAWVAVTPPACACSDGRCAYRHSSHSVSEAALGAVLRPAEQSGKGAVALHLVAPEKGPDLVRLCPTGRATPDGIRATM